MEAQVAVKNQSKKNQKSIAVAVAPGDGIGPEIMDATLKILEAAGAKITTHNIQIGKEVYLSGELSGIDKAAWDTIRKTKLILKGPITTPQGSGYKSLNVTLRKSLGLFANVRPVKTYEPLRRSGAPKMDVVIIRENEEDLYAGIEHQQTQDVVQCLKLITRPGCEKIVRYAFEYARIHDRQRVTCMIKDNIMKLTDGLFHRVFKEIAQEYPDIQSDSQIIDIGSARLAARPDQYDVVVTSNLYGDIISDIVAEVAGSVGLAGSANVGRDIAMFEAIHGSAPDIAGSSIANPTGLLMGACMMLEHIGQFDVAGNIRQAWFKTIQAGIHTADIYDAVKSQRKVGTSEFADAVIENLDHQASQTTTTSERAKINIPFYNRPKAVKSLLGVDVFIDWQGSDADEIGDRLAKINGGSLKLKMITNRGVKVYPNGLDETYCTDHWRCRFGDMKIDDQGKKKYLDVNYDSVLTLLSAIDKAGFEVIKTENLYSFDGVRGFSLGQGE